MIKGGMMQKLISRVVGIEYHRNGVSGTGFHIVHFKKPEGRKRQDMIAIVFDEPGCVAVFDYDKFKAGDFAWMSNSWRGDDFESELRTAIQKAVNE